MGEYHIQGPSKGPHNLTSTELCHIKGPSKGPHNLTSTEPHPKSGTDCICIIKCALRVSKITFTR
jgi:hypothetical protein